jgi:hypothetical protein
VVRLAKCGYQFGSLDVGLNWRMLECQTVDERGEPIEGVAHCLTLCAG